MQWLTTFEGAGLDGVIAKRLDGPYLPGKREMVKVKHARDADCVAIGYRIHKSGEGVGSILLGLYRDDGELQMVGGAASFTAKDRLKLLADLEPLREGDEPVDGEPSRWNSAADKRWIPVRPEKVGEVAYDQMEGNTVHGQRFRHAVQVRPLAARPRSAELHLRPARRAGELRSLRRTGVLKWQACRRTRRRRRQGPADQPGQAVLPEARRRTAPRASWSTTTWPSPTGPMLTALRDRPTHLQRFPDGIEGEEIYQKRVPQKHPDYLETCVVTFPSGRTADALKVTHPSAIVWAAQMGTVTLHPWQVRCPDTEHPDELRIDLDPQPGTGFAEARTHRRRRAQAAARRARHGRLSEDLRRPGRARLSADRARLGLHRGAPGGHRAGPRDRAARTRRGHHVVVEGGARRAGVHRLQPERARPHLRVGVLGAQNPDRHGVDAADVGRARRRRPRRLHHRDRPGLPGRPGRPVGRHRREAQSLLPLLDMVKADEEQGLGDLPYPPSYPKMPGEPPRVQPSKKVAANWDEDGNPLGKS